MAQHETLLEGASNGIGETSSDDPPSAIHTNGSDKSLVKPTSENQEKSEQVQQYPKLAEVEKSTSAATLPSIAIVKSNDTTVSVSSKKDAYSPSPDLVTGKEESPKKPLNDEQKIAPHPLDQLSDVALKQLNSMAKQPKALIGNDQNATKNRDGVQSVGDNPSNSKEPQPRPKSKKPEKRSTKPKKSKANLRKGKWTAEEEEYTMRIIQHFRTGLLSLPDGHTLRSFLAEKLNCDPMRITKKFSGASCLGKRVYNLCDRSQVTARDLQLAKVELETLERRFRLRIEHGSSLPISSHISESLRNTRNELDHANFMRASYLFVNNPAQNQVGGGMDLSALSNIQAAGNALNPGNYGGGNVSLSFLQSLASQQQASQQAFQTINPVDNQFQLQKHLQRHHQHDNPPVRSNAAPFFEVQQQQNPLNSNLLSALMTAHAGQSNDPSQQLSSPLYTDALKVLSSHASAQNPSYSNQIGSTSMIYNDQNNHLSGHMMQHAQGTLGLNDQGQSAMEALAARYNSAALNSKWQQDHLQRQQIKEEQYIRTTGRSGQINAGNASGSHDTAIDRQEALKTASQQPNPPKKVRTKEEQAEGRMLLGFLQELQSNHQKAKLSTLQNVQDSNSSVPQLQSTGTSTDGTSTTFATRDSLSSNGIHNPSSNKEGLLKRGFDISVKKYSDSETASSVSGFAGSVAKSEVLSRGYGGSSNDSSLSDDRDQFGSGSGSGSSGDDADKDNRPGPLRKRFRRNDKASLRTNEDGSESDNEEKRDH